MLFAQGKRPDAEAVRAFSAECPFVSISHDNCPITPALRVVSDKADPTVGVSVSDAADHAWMELLRDGLTFDCTGLAPAACIQAPNVAHRFDVDPAAELNTMEAIHLAPGAHLAAGGKTLPVIRGLLAITRDLMQHFEDAVAACWPPSQAAIGRRFFDSTISAWLDGGPFPALGLTAFGDESDGSLVSVGLSHFIDQEIRIEPSLASNKLAATRLGIRLINQLVLVGGIDQSERIIGPDGSRLLLHPSRNGKFVRVSQE